MTGQDQNALQDLNASTESTITFMASGSPDTDHEKDLMIAICNSNIEETGARVRKQSQYKIEKSEEKDT